MKIKTFEEKLREIITFHGDEGMGDTSGYLLSDEQQDKIKQLAYESAREAMMRRIYPKQSEMEKNIIKEQLKQAFSVEDEQV